VNTRFLLFCLRASVFSLMVCCFSFPSYAVEGSSVSVVVDGAAITTREIEERSVFLRLVHPKHSDEALNRMAREELIVEVLRANEAEARRVHISDQELDKAFAMVAKNMGTETDILFEWLTQNGISIQTFSDRIKSQSLWTKLVISRFSGRVSIPEERIVRALEEQSLAGTAGLGKDAIARGRSVEYTLYEVVMVARDGVSEYLIPDIEKLRKKINGCASLLKAVAEFEDVVVTPLGKHTSDTLPKDLSDELEATPVGRLSEVVSGDQSTMRMFVVCDKRSVQGDLSIRARAEKSLSDQEVWHLARRYMTEIQRRAVILYQ